MAAEQGIRTEGLQAFTFWQCVTELLGTTQPTKAKEILEQVANSLKAAFSAHRTGTGRRANQLGKSHRLIFDMSSDDEQASAVHQDAKDILNLSRVDKCLISMEELEMDIKNMIHKQMQEEDGQQDSQEGD